MKEVEKENEKSGTEDFNADFRKQSKSTTSIDNVNKKGCTADLSTVEGTDESNTDTGGGIGIALTEEAWQGDNEESPPAGIVPLKNDDSSNALSNPDNHGRRTSEQHNVA